MRITDMTGASSQLRKLGLGAKSMEEVSQRVARFLFDSFGDAETGHRGCVLVRVYKPPAYGALPAPLQAFAAGLGGGAIAPSVRCLALLGTVGVEPVWCSRHAPQGHKAIP